MQLPYLHKLESESLLKHATQSFDGPVVTPNAISCIDRMALQQLGTTTILARDDLRALAT